jgi:hypothetical protein
MTLATIAALLARARAIGAAIKTGNGIIAAWNHRLETTERRWRWVPFIRVPKQQGEKG